jgi:predicted GNAT family acetyltransferase
MQNGEQIGEMVIGVSDKTLTVFHTEISEKVEGKGLAMKLLDAMVAYAREHHLMVIPRCAYVHAQFKKHPETYADIWQKETGE